MVRTRIQLMADRYRRLRRWARQLGVPLLEAARCCVAERLVLEERAPSREERVRAALAVCGRYTDPDRSSRVVADHDRHLAEAYRR